MDTVRIGLAGFGTVGQGLASILRDHGDWIARRLDARIAIKSVLVRNLAKPRSIALGPDVVFTTDPDSLVNDPELFCIVELMGGIEAPRALITRALRAGKHVVTANKHLLAEHGPELFALAAEQGVGLYYEASVAGGIPVIQTLKESLAGDRIREVLGILNGTANYILSEMTSSTSRLDFDTALRQAQDLGYAEADPTLDIEGFDTAHKLVVLIRLAFGCDYPLAKLRVEGITRVTRLDIEFAREFGYRVKLMASAREVNGRIEAGVYPAFVKYTYLLARVGGNYNAVRVEGEAVGPVMLHGQGAGATPTGNAVLADIMALIRHRRCSGCGPDNTGFGNTALPPAAVLPPEEAVSCHYLRFTVQDKPGVMAAIARAMAERGVSIAQAVQKGEAGHNLVPLVFLTHEAPYAAVRATMDAIDAMDFIAEPTVHFRIL
ncbi:MAG: homoserine dehydrogenase [Desulfovibrionaceae bacterium]